MGMKMRMTPGRMQLSSYNRNPLGEEDSDVQEVRLLLNEGKVRQKANMSHIMQKPCRHGNKYDKMPNTINNNSSCLNEKLARN